jgi:hypothetical protein
LSPFTHDRCGTLVVRRRDDRRTDVGVDAKPVSEIEDGRFLGLEV